MVNEQATVQIKNSLADDIKAVIFAIVTLAIVAGNFFLEGKLAGAGQADVSDLSAFSYEEDNIIAGSAVVRFDNGELIGSPKMELKLAEDPYYVFNLEQGTLWGNFLANNSKVNILVSNVVVIPSHAVFELKFDGERLNVSTYNGDLYLGFLPADFEFTGYSDAYSGMFMNRILVPRGTQVTIPLRKVTQDLKPLLYSKLVKEFQYAAIPETAKETQWVKNNLEKDQRFIGALSQQFISEVIFKGLTVKNSLFANFIFWSEENLTFIPEKKFEIILAHLFAYLDDAIFYANEGSEEKMQASLDGFVGYLNSIPDKVLESEDYKSRMDNYIDHLSVFNPTDKEYKIFKFLLNRKFLEKRDVYDVVAMFWSGVYKGLDLGQLPAEEALNSYYEYLDQTIGENLDADFYKMYITYQNQLFDNLLLRYPLFYKDGYFAIKNVLEQTLVDLYVSGQLKDELRQAFVSNKIDFLKRLRRFFFDGKIEVAAAKEIFSRLFEEIDKLMPADGSGVAVIELFESQLNDIDDFWGYLNSPEYHGQIYGNTNEERYENYLIERDKIWSFINIREDVLGEAVSEEKDIMDVYAEIENSFDANSDVANLEISPIDTVDQRYVEVRATLAGYPFKASYDRDTDSLKDIYVYDELVSDRPVKLNSLLVLLQEKFASLADEIDSGDDEEITLETTAQRYARIFIANKISEFGFIATMDNVSVIDELNAYYRATGVGFEDYEEVELTFDILMTEEVVTNVMIEINGKPTVLNDKYTLEQLAELVTAGQEGELEIDAESEGLPVDSEEADVFAPVLR